MQMVEPSSLNLLPALQPREHLDLAYVDELAEWLVDNPNLDIKPYAQGCSEGGKGDDILIYDGHHRVRAYIKAKRTVMPVEVIKGDYREALLRSLGANADHGKQRTTEDKRRAVMVCLSDDEWADKSSRWIAEQCKVGDKFVTKIREEDPQVRSTAPVDNVRKGQDGKTYRVPDQPTAPRKFCPSCARKIRVKQDLPKACPDCKKLNTGPCPPPDFEEYEPKPKPTPNAPKPPKIGSEIFNWDECTNKLAPRFRVEDDIARAFPEEKGSKEYNGMQRLEKEMVDLYIAWAYKITGIKNITSKNRKH